MQALQHVTANNKERRVTVGNGGHRNCHATMTAPAATQKSTATPPKALAATTALNKNSVNATAPAQIHHNITAHENRC